jgi:hypothetical protein
MNPSSETLLEHLDEYLLVRNDLACHDNDSKMINIITNNWSQDDYDAYINFINDKDTKLKTFTRKDLTCIKYFIKVSNIQLQLSENPDTMVNIMNNNWSNEIKEQYMRYQLSINNFERDMNLNKLEMYQEISFFIVGKKSDTIAGCIKLIDGYYMNIYDFINRDKFLLSEIVFTNLDALRARCDKVGYYPKKQAKGEFFRLLMQHLH